MERQPLATLVSLAGKTALVTGGAMGIGEGISYRLAEAGATVLIGDLDAAAAAKAAAELTAKGWQAQAVQLDVADEASVAAAVAANPTIDILVNNAGIYPNTPLTQMTPADFDRVLGVNLRGVFLCTKAVSAQMVARGAGGRIINVTSIDALHPSMVGLAHYDASKHGAWGFTKSAALEYAPHGIRVNAVAPGGIVTPGVAALSSGASAEQIHGRMARVMIMRRLQVWASRWTAPVGTASPGPPGRRSRVPRLVVEMACAMIVGHDRERTPLGARPACPGHVGHLVRPRRVLGPVQEGGAPAVPHQRPPDPG